MRFTHIFGLVFWGICLIALNACNSLLDWEDRRSCGNGVVASDEECDDGNDRDGDGCSSACLIEFTPSKKVDVLLVVDFSPDMVDFHATLMDRFPDLLSWLQIVKGGLPDLHIGVTSMDVGALGNDTTTCSGDGDDGRLQKHDCPNLPDHHYIVDIAPAGCDIAQSQRPGEELQCTGHTCSDLNCKTPLLPGIEPADLKLVADDRGCPRCRNYVVDDLHGVLSCLMDRPVDSCGWEQPLEAMARALTSPHPENFNFRRPEAHLVVIFLLSEDDCTAATPDLFNPEAAALGTPGSFRCWQWGVRCDEPWELDPANLVENYSGCRPRTESEGGKLMDVNRYVNELRGHVVNEKGRFFVHAVTFAGPRETTLQIRYENDRWQIRPVEGTDVLPNLRLFDFTWRLSLIASDMQWSFHNLLSESWEAPLVQLGQRLRTVIERSLPAL